MAQELGMSYHAIHFSKNGLGALPELGRECKICLATNTHTPVDTLPKKILKQTELLLHANSGYDNFPPEWVREQKFPILLGNEIRAQAVTQYILTHLFAHFNKREHQAQWDKTRKWHRPLLDKQNILILGHGEIGKKLEASLSPLTKNIKIHDPFQARELDLSRKLPEADILLFACSLNESSRHLLNSENIKLLKSDILIINAARGPLIKEEALINFLKENRQAFAVLDVFEQEPFKEQFKDLSNIYTTSHIAGVSKDLDQRIVEFARKALHEYKNGQEVKGLAERYFNYEGTGILI